MSGPSKRLDPELVFARLTVEQGLIARPDVERCCRIRQQERATDPATARPLSYIFMNEGLATLDDLRGILRLYKFRRLRQYDRSLAEIALEKEVVTPDQLAKAFAVQLRLYDEDGTARHLGEILLANEWTDGASWNWIHELSWARRKGDPDPGRPAEAAQTDESMNPSD